MESILPELIGVIMEYLPELDKAFLSLTSTYFRKLIKRKYSLLASCVVEDNIHLALVESWGNNWNEHECTILGSSSAHHIFRQHREFTIEQTEWIGYSVAHSNNPLVADFSRAVDMPTPPENRKAYYYALVRGAVDSNNLEVIERLSEEYFETWRYLKEYAAEKHNIEAFLHYQRCPLMGDLSTEIVEWLREQPEKIKQRLHFQYQLQIQ